MAELPRVVSHVAAVVQEIFPRMGLAYVLDDTGSSWGVTRSTPGVGLENLRPGQRLQVTVQHHGDFMLASGYTPID